MLKILVPDERDEAIRDLVRAREDARAARHRVRLQTQAMMLRHGRHYQGKRSWTQAHDRHLSTIRRSLEVSRFAKRGKRIIRDISWKAQLRLSKRWRSLSMGRKLAQNKICVAIARELSGFIWAVARHVKVNP
jgi:hypothetical protein